MIRFFAFWQFDFAVFSWIVTVTFSFIHQEEIVVKFELSDFYESFSNVSWKLRDRQTNGRMNGLHHKIRAL